MGNSTSDSKAASVKAAESSGSFNKRELVCIKELYTRLLVDEEKEMNHGDSTAKTTTTTTFPVTLPHLRHLLSKRGVLKDVSFFCQFLDEAMRINSSQTLEVIWDLWEEGDNSTVFAIESSDRLCLFFELLIEIAMCHRKEVNLSSQKAMAEMLVACVLKNNMNNNDDTNSDQESSSSHQLMMLKRWCALYGPRTAKIFESYLTELCFPHEHNPSFFPYRSPSFIGKYPLSDVLPNGALDLIPLSLYHESLQGDWTRLYSSSVDGLSFNRMAHHVMGYDGPMCFLIKPQRRTNCVFGAFTSGRWREFNRFYGSSDTFLFTLRPNISIIRSRDRSNGNYQWLNQKSFGMPHGLGFGGTHEGFRLFITESYEQCRAAESCMTFESGKLLPDGQGVGGEGEGGIDRGQGRGNESTLGSDRYQFELDVLEVWACGGEELIQRGMEAQIKEREIRDENIQKARKVDKGAFFGNAFDREFLLSKTLGHKANDRSNNPDMET